MSRLQLSTDHHTRTLTIPQDGVGVTVYDVAQGTPEWLALRGGCLTASAAKAMLSTVKTGEAAARRDLRTKLVCERLTGAVDEDPYTNKDMEHGKELEPVARARYQAETGHLVTQVGFLKIQGAPVGCSPDGLVADDGMIEVKAPRSARHLSYLRCGGIPTEHRAQLLHAMFVSGRRWIDFVSYNAKMPDGLQLYICRLERDQAEIVEYATKVSAFLAEVDAEVKEVEGLRRG